MKRKKKEILFYVMTIVSCLVAMTVVVAAALLIYDKLIRERQEGSAEASAGAVYSKEEMELLLADAVKEAEESAEAKISADLLEQIKESFVAGPSTVESLRPFYPNDIVVVSNGRFHFVPIRDDLKKHNLSEENLRVLEDGEMQYVENGEVVSHKGIDVSRNQGDIDWEKVAADGVEFVIIKVGARGWGAEGNLLPDARFEEYIAGASAAGLKIGVYFYSQAITEEEALEEANLVLDAVAGYDLAYPIVYDVEKTAEKKGRMNQLSVEERTRMAQVFIERIKEAGYTPMIYSNMEMWSVLIDMAAFEDVEKWFAYYGPSLYFPYEYAVWQYSETGVVDGIKEKVDMNISFREW